MKFYLPKYGLLIGACLFAAVSCGTSTPEYFADDDFERSSMYEEEPQQQMEAQEADTHDYSNYDEEDWFYDYYDVEPESSEEIESATDYYDI